MGIRRASFIFMCVVLLGVFVAAGQPNPRRERVLMAKDVSAYIGSGLVVTVREIQLAPAARGSKHRHPGPVVVCVLSGAVEVALDGQSPRTYRRGTCFSEDARQFALVFTESECDRARSPAVVHSE